MGGSDGQEVDQEEEWREGAGGSAEELFAVPRWCDTWMYPYLWLEH